MTRKRRIHAPEFKSEVLRLVESGRTISAVAREMDLSSSVIHSWLRQRKSAEESQSAGVADGGQQDDVNKLRRRVRELELERDILKKATVWFAKHVP